MSELAIFGAKDSYRLIDGQHCFTKETTGVGFMQKSGPKEVSVWAGSPADGSGESVEYSTGPDGIETATSRSVKADFGQKGKFVAERQRSKGNDSSVLTETLEFGIPNDYISVRTSDISRLNDVHKDTNITWQKGDKTFQIQLNPDGSIRSVTDNGNDLSQREARAVYENGVLPCWKKAQEVAQKLGVNNVMDVLTYGCAPEADKLISATSKPKFIAERELGALVKKLATDAKKVSV